MKTKLLFSFFTATLLMINSYAQDITTVEAVSGDIAENLDLEAVATLFGQVENLEEFENKLNDPETRISNLDLNHDGNVDYLRVVENSKNNTHLITIQAVIGRDLFQDVATIDVEKDNEGNTHVQVVGDIYMYGPDYYIEPVYFYRPVIFIWFWGPHYHHWYSPYYWDYYPSHFHYWHPCHSWVYYDHIHVYVSTQNTYYYSDYRSSKTAVELQKETRKNDYEKQNPEMSFVNRNGGVKNKTELVRTQAPDGEKTKDDKISTGKEVQEDWKTESEKKGEENKVKDNKVVVPSDNKKKDDDKEPYFKPNKDKKDKQKKDYEPKRDKPKKDRSKKQTPKKDKQPKQDKKKSDPKKKKDD